MSEGMKIIAINDAPTVSDNDLNRIITDIGMAEGHHRNSDVLRARNNALRAYIFFALRGRQRADAQYDAIAADEALTMDEYSKASGKVYEDVREAQDAVERAFEHLIVCQFALNRS